LCDTSGMDSNWTLQKKRESGPGPMVHHAKNKKTRASWSIRKKKGRGFRGSPWSFKAKEASSAVHRSFQRVVKEEKKRQKKGQPTPLTLFIHAATSKKHKEGTTTSRLIRDIRSKGGKEKKPRACPWSHRYRETKEESWCRSASADPSSGDRKKKKKEKKRGAACAV